MTKKGNKTNIFSEWQENWSGWGQQVCLGGGGVGGRRVGGVSLPHALSLNIHQKMTSLSSHQRESAILKCQ